MAEAGGDGDQIVVLQSLANELDGANSFKFVRLQFVIGTAAVECAAMVNRYWNARPLMSELDGSIVAESQ